MTEFSAVYGRTADGLLAARIGDIACIAVPVCGGLRLATAWRLAKPLDQWRAGDALASEGIVADDMAFRAHVEDVAHHQRQLGRLSRQRLTTSCRTPWGATQQATVYAEGIVFHATASHGGFKLSPERLAHIDPLLRVRNGWYEEDVGWAKVAAAFPHLFTDRENAAADRTLRASYPQIWADLRRQRLG
ncbi:MULTISPECIES: hypothetical protein [unclassified Novosphingobium]|uniref:DUF7007 domain-containing protein n=1 Tax=unclassified Novosphingobium TaxID=2644732 RepID=UPI00146D947B|nr:MULTISPECIES: hypothetical protein [unclassified Novosphingobium]NMN03816.1 hypothetical protein [Novosphingobium sp. SG919]NMN86194.1 hypothetical protein [Novosphingobium sp. SG916]